MSLRDICVGSVVQGFPPLHVREVSVYQGSCAGQCHLLLCHSCGIVFPLVTSTGARSIPCYFAVFPAIAAKGKEMSLIWKLSFLTLAVNEFTWNIRVPRAARSSSPPAHNEINQMCSQRGKPKDHVENACKCLFPSGLKCSSLQGLGHGFP